MGDSVLEIFKTTGAIKEGHFLLASGLHSPVYWEKFRILQYPHYTEKLCRLIAEYFNEQNIEVVVGPITGGIILAFETARQLGVRGIFAEKEGALRTFRRDFAIVCALLRLGLSKDEIWPLVSDTSKFESNGWPYFDRTVTNAERTILLEEAGQCGAQSRAS